MLWLEWSELPWCDIRLRVLLNAPKYWISTPHFLHFLSTLQTKSCQRKVIWWSQLLCFSGAARNSHITKMLKTQPLSETHPFCTWIQSSTFETTHTHTFIICTSITCSLSSTSGSKFYILCLYQLTQGYKWTAVMSNTVYT